MAVLKCKMCGGDLNVTSDETVVECEYCGSKQTVPTADSEKKMNLFARANRLLRNCEFDKAAGIYESIVAEFTEEAEAYWGLVLCKYGIEYVDDPATGKKIPTCHRSSFDSVMDDKDFELVMEYADGIARRVYREQAKQMEELRKAIIEVSGKEEPYDIFISYKETDDSGERTLDSVIAQDIYTELTGKGYRVFFSRISLEDKLGTEYEPYIFAALNSAKVMLVVGTDYDYFNAVWVKNEWSRFLALIAKGEKKTLIPVFKNIDAYDMPKEFAKLSAQDMGKVGAMQDLLRGVDKILGRTAQPAAAPAQPQTVIQQVVNGTSAETLLKRGYMSLEDGAFEEAKGYFNDALNSDTENAEAYFGLFMADVKAKNKTEAKSKYISSDYSSNRFWQRTRQFASGNLAAELREFTIARGEKLEADRIAKEKAEEEARIAKKKAEEKSKKLAEELTVVREKLKPFEGLVSVSQGFIAAVKADGTVVSNKIEDTRELRNIIRVRCDGYSLAGITREGTVVKAGSHNEQIWKAAEWTNIADIAFGTYYAAGLKRDGRVVWAKFHNQRETGVANATDIVQICCGGTRGPFLLNKNGAVCGISGGQSSYHNIVSICSTVFDNIELQADGTVKYAEDYVGVKEWHDIVSICAGFYHVVGLKRDGTVVAGMHKRYQWKTDECNVGQCNVGGWRNIVAISAGDNGTVGITASGRVLYTGAPISGREYVTSAKLCGNFASMEEMHLAEVKKQEEIKAQIAADKARKAAEKAKLIEELKAERNQIKEDIPNLKGVFANLKRKSYESRLESIEKQLKQLQSSI